MKSFKKSIEQINEKAGGRTSGLIQLGETVKWKTTHFNLNFAIIIKIVELIRPYHYTDEMIKDPFKQFRHQHIFEKTFDGTLMTDRLDFKSPLGILRHLSFLIRVGSQSLRGHMGIVFLLCYFLTSEKEI
ncbi:MAG: hypothetical protein ABIY90_06475 [Puia sp.]